MQKDEALARAVTALSRELKELVEDGLRLGWTITFNKTSGLMSLRSPGLHGETEYISIPRGERSLNDGKSRAWHSKLRRYADPARLNDLDRELLGQRPKIPTKSLPPKPSDLPQHRPVEEVPLPVEPNPALVAEVVDKARSMQEAVNELGAGPVHREVQEAPTRKRQFNGRRTRNKPCLICGKLKKNMGPHLKWHRERGEILVIKKDGKEMELSTTPEKAGVDLRKQEISAVVRPTKHMAMQEALELIAEAASDALGRDGKELHKQIEQLQRHNSQLLTENEELRNKLADIRKMFVS